MYFLNVLQWKERYKEGPLGEEIKILYLYRHCTQHSHCYAAIAKNGFKQAGYSYYTRHHPLGANPVYHT